MTQAKRQTGSRTCDHRRFQASKKWPWRCKLPTVSPAGGNSGSGVGVGGGVGGVGGGGGVLAVMRVVVVLCAMASRCQADAILTTVPDCFKSCSDQVGCSITANSCHSEQTTALDVAGAVRELQAATRVDSTHQYVNLTWQPPADGSYRDLEGFQVNVQVHGMAQPTLGILGSWCFRFDLEANWTQRYVHHGSVHFHFRCLRLSKDSNLNLHVTVWSLPLNAAVPKAAHKIIEIYPVTDQKHWNPELQRWADDKNALHVRIRNPLKAAALYHLVLLSSSHRQTVFSRILPANSTTGQPPASKFTTSDADGFPHYVIPGLDTRDNYSIILHPLYENQTHVLKWSVHTKVFSPNFTATPNLSRGQKISGIGDGSGDQPNNIKNNNKTSSSSSQPASSPHHLDGPLIAMVLVTVLMLLLAIFFLALCWRLYRRPRMLRACLPCGGAEMGPGGGGAGTHRRGWDPYKAAGRLDGGRGGVVVPEDSKILPIYCQESDSYVKAVESHVRLLDHYVDIISFQGQRSRSFGRRWLCDIVAPLSRVYSEVKSQDAIIYLSPRLIRIARLGNIDDLEGVTDLDRYCHNALLSLGRKRGRCEERYSPHLVTFDCFQNAERDHLRAALGNMVQGLSAPASHGQESWEPLKLASFASGSPKLVNFEPLLFRLCQLRGFPRELPAGSHDWHATHEARETETHLSRFLALPCHHLHHHHRHDDGSCLQVDLHGQDLSSEENNRDEGKECGPYGSDISPISASIRHSKVNGPHRSNTPSRSSPVCNESSTAFPNEGSETGSAGSKWTPTKERRRFYQRSECNSVSPPMNDDVMVDAKHWGSSPARDSIRLTSFDSGFMSKPVVANCDPTTPESVAAMPQCHKRYPSSPGLLTNGIESGTKKQGEEEVEALAMRAPPGVGKENNRAEDFPSESDSDNNEYEGVTGSGDLESDHLLRCTRGKFGSSVSPSDSPPLLLIRNSANGGLGGGGGGGGKGSGTSLSAMGQCRIVPPRFLPNLAMGATSSISDLIKGINDKTAWT